MLPALKSKPRRPEPAPGQAPERKAQESKRRWKAAWTHRDEPTIAAMPAKIAVKTAEMALVQARGSVRELAAAAI